MDIYYVPQFYAKAFHAGVKPSTDFEDVLKKIGAKRIGLKRIFVPDSRIARILNSISSKWAEIRMPKDSVVYLQYPMQPNIKRLFSRSKKNNNKVILLVHDINELRGKECNYSDLLKDADGLIIHTLAMQKWIEENYGNRNNVILGMFDYIIDKQIGEYKKSVDGWHISFAGNLLKAPFLSKLSLKNTNIYIDLYGPGYDPNFKKDNVIYNGKIDPEILPMFLAKSDFGLIWDGDDVNACNGLMGYYLRFNCPYKASSYLAAGLPLITWKQSGIAEFITQNGIGFAVDSLREIPSLLCNLSESQYNEMRSRVKRIQEQIITGKFYETAIKKSLKILTDKVNHS